MKSTIKLILAAALFSSVVIADEGNMGNSGKTCTPPATTCLVIDNEPVDTTTDKKESGAEQLSFFDYIENYLRSIFE